MEATVLPIPLIQRATPVEAEEPSVERRFAWLKGGSTVLACALTYGLLLWYL
jgi:hypothetical protein